VDQSFRSYILAGAAALMLFVPLNAAAQQRAEDTQTTRTRWIEGTVTSARRGSIIIRTDEGRFLVFRVDRTTQRVKPIQAGMRVNVITMSNDTDTAPLATTVNILSARADAPPSDDPIPDEARRLESQIERQARRYRMGVEAGVALDPELIPVGAHATFGPFFSENVMFRPNVELALGEVTTLFAIHLDVLYAIPGATRQTRWAPYVGAGPNFSFSHRGFEGEEDGNRFDFGEFDANSGVNFIVGMRNPNGVFVEMKATAYGVANLRLSAGVDF
jgi:hypothetical protein